MRFASFELLRYGHFADQRLIFPQRETDFHLIYGNNEAGKSTLRQAFHDLLFGIPMNTSMAFMHAGPDLALNAVLTGEAGQLAMGRRRKRAGGLVDGAGESLPEDVFQRWLEGMTPAFHERMFCLDHPRLERGSRAMLQAEDDVDSVLFQAAAGLATLNGVLASLREEAAGLWTPHHSRNRAWYAAHDRYKDAEKTLKAVTVRPTTWVTAERESRRTDEAFTKAQQECARLRARMRELERMRRLAPLLAQIRESERIVSQQGAEQRSPILELEADILSLDETRLRVAGHNSEIVQCDTQMALLHEQLCKVMRHLGRPVSAAATELASLEDLSAGLPPLPLRHEITQLVAEGREVRRRREAALHARQARETEIAELRARISALPQHAVGRAVRRALEAATSAGDILGNMEALARKVEREEAELVQGLKALQQPEFRCELRTDSELQGNAERLDDALAALEGMQPLPAGALVEEVQLRQALRAKLDAAHKRLSEAELELQAARLKAQQFRRSHQAVSRDEVLAARRDRDVLWEAMLAGRTPLTAQGQAYTALVLLADTLADRHLEAVDDAARLQTLEHECERLESALQYLSEHHAAAVQDLREYDLQWQAQCQRRRLPQLSPAALQSWLPGREAVLGVRQKLSLSRSEHEALCQRHDALLKAIGAALLTEQALHADQVSSLGLVEACDIARTLLAQADTAAARREALTEQLHRLQPLLPTLEQEFHKQEAAYQEWQERRRYVLQRAGLPGDADDAYVEAAIVLLGEADGLMNRLREIHAERQRLSGELWQFHRDVETLAQRLGQKGVPLHAAGEHLRGWVAELAPLRAAERDREQARQRLQRLGADLLKEAEGRSREQVEAELAQVDFASLAAESEALGLQLEAAEHERDRLAIERQNARQALEEISGGDDAAQAEAMRQEALADMGEAAERYVRVYAQYRLLEHITDRYRERSQGPLLARAGQLFSELTLGAYTGLDVDGDVASLLARRADRRLVQLGGLSDGTRDQLYLALRLAALELYLDSARPMPFIADDLFINYDNRRSLAGLRQLLEVSRRTQVIFLTHHAHVVELAQEHLAGQVQVIELGLPA